MRNDRTLPTDMSQCISGRQGRNLDAGLSRVNKNRLQEAKVACNKR
jgi:hypothetical protein